MADNYTGTGEEAAAREAASLIEDAWNALVSFFGAGQWPWDKRVYTFGVVGLWGDAQMVSALYDYQRPWKTLKHLTGWARSHYRTAHTKVFPDFLAKPVSQRDDIDEKRVRILETARDSYRAAVQSVVLATHGAMPPHPGPAPRDGVPFPIIAYHKTVFPAPVPSGFLSIAKTDAEREAIQTYIEWSNLSYQYYKIVTPAAKAVDPWAPSKAAIEGGGDVGQPGAGEQPGVKAQMVRAAKRWYGPPVALWAMRRAFVAATVHGAGVLVRYMQYAPDLFRRVAIGFPVQQIPDWSLLSDFGTPTMAEKVGEALDDFFDSLAEAGSQIASWVEDWRDLAEEAGARAGDLFEVGRKYMEE